MSNIESPQAPQVGDTAPGELVEHEGHTIRYKIGKRYEHDFLGFVTLEDPHQSEGVFYAKTDSGNGYIVSIEKLGNEVPLEELKQSTDGNNAIDTWLAIGD